MDNFQQAELPQLSALEGTLTVDIGGGIPWRVLATCFVMI